MGKNSCREALEWCLIDYRTRLLVCVGIAGCISDDVAIGDVCYSGTIIDVTDNTKISGGKQQREVINLSSRAYSTPREITVPIARSRLSPVSKPAYLEWREHCASRARDLIDGEFPGRNGRQERIEVPTAREGAIICGLVSGSPEYNRKLKGVERKALAIETESGALTSVADMRGIPALTIRGISDYAGVDKTEFEIATKNRARNVAAYNAGTFLARQLASPAMAAHLEKYRHQATNSDAQLSLLPTPAIDSIGSLLIRIGDICDERLRELAPGFKLQAPGYRLPLPRIQVQGRAEHLSGGGPIDIREAMRETRVLTIHVPREYPDLSLAWIIANDLISTQIDDAQVVPCVIEARDVQLPRRGIRDLADPQITRLIGTPDSLPIFIIDDFPLSSNTKSAFIKRQIDEMPDAKFIILVRTATATGDTLEQTGSFGGLSAKLSEISFSELSQFVQRNFALEASASEVIALRLCETFAQYRLSAHPSYIAGIPRDTLNALLQANRRAELLEIAVVGYLSYIVADDQEPIALSRKTREKFLSELAFSMRAKGKIYSDTELTTYAEAFAKRYDFNIVPVRFIAAFIDKGILHVADGKVRFTLPFMEAYLLAKRLSESEEDAIKYFQLRAENFDHLSFTIYAEIGASETLVSKVLEDLDVSTNAICEGVDQEFILFQNTLNPALLERHERLRTIHRKLQQAEEDVRNDRDQSREKQRMLDTTDIIRETTSAKIAEARQKQGDELHATAQGQAMSIWSIALSLLGSGAERLEGQIKRELVEKVIRLTVAIINGWTRDTSSINFSEITDEIINNEELLRKAASSDSKEDRESAAKLLHQLIEFFEYMTLMQPFMTAIITLCEEARDDVLPESILKANVSGQANELIRNLWLSDISVEKGRKLLRDSVKQLPKHKLIRTLIMSHLMFRVYWKQWKKGDRVELLNIAKESLRGIGMAVKFEDMEKMLGPSPNKP